MKNHLLNLFICSGLISLSGCRTSPQALPAPVSPPGELDSHLIYIHNHGKHTGITVQASKMNEQIPGLKNRFPDVRYYEIGWGDAGFYQADKITAALTVPALFWPTPTVLHIVGYNHEPLHYFSESKNRQLYLTDSELKNIINFIALSFRRDEADALMLKRVGIYGDSQFYEAVGKYHLFNTCNKWTAKALSSAGVDISIPLKITSGSVMRVLPP